MGKHAAAVILSGLLCIGVGIVVCLMPMLASIKLMEELMEESTCVLLEVCNLLISTLK